MNTPCVAVIDVGSNSIKLLVAHLVHASPKNTIHALCHHSRETRISCGISQIDHALSEETIQRAIHSIQELLNIAKDYQPKRIRIVATSAVRDAINQALFANTLYTLTGHKLEILSGQDEALSIARGIQYDPDLESINDFCLFDLGGGSTEFIRCDNKRISQAISLPLGAVRVMEQCVPHPDHPMTPAIADCIQEHVRTLIHTSGFSFLPKGRCLIGTGGAITVTRMLLQHTKNGTVFPLTQEAIEELFAKIAKMPIEERLKIRSIPHKRADIFPTALAIILTIMRLSGTHTLYHSYYSLRFGIASEILENL